MADPTPVAGEPPWWSWDTEDDESWLAEFSGEDVRALVRERSRLRAASPAALDVAWQAAWDALPGPTWSVNVRRRRHGGRWEAWAQNLADETTPPLIRIGEGYTEAAALLDVAARLTEQEER